MGTKKKYIKPQVIRIELDYSVSLRMLSAPTNPPPRGDASRSTPAGDPFASPFGDKPFS